MGALSEYTVEPVVRGVCPVLETPFRSDGAVDEEGFVTVAQHVISTGVSSVMFPGFASEFYKLTEVERSRLTGVLLGQTRDVDVTAVVSIPDHATRIAVRRAIEAVEAGADAINILPPYFLAPSDRAVHDHIGAVLEAISPTPAILQFAPTQTGTGLDAHAITELARAHPNLRQVKVESTPPGALIAALERERPAISSVVGYAGVQLPDALRRGAIGVQPGCSFVELYLLFWARWEAGDQRGATDLHTRMLPYLSYWMQGVELIIAAEKLISQRRGLIKSAYCRAPAYHLDDQEVRMIDRFLDEFPVVALGSST